MTSGKILTKSTVPTDYYRTRRGWGLCESQDRGQTHADVGY